MATILKQQYLVSWFYIQRTHVDGQKAIRIKKHDSKNNPENVHFVESLHNLVEISNLNQIGLFQDLIGQQKNMAEIKLIQNY